MKKISGIVASTGLASGVGYVLPEESQFLILAYYLNDEDIPIHEKRLDEALDQAKLNLQVSIDKARLENQKETVSIFETHLSMLQDTSFIEEVKEDLRKNKMNIEFTLKKKVDELVAILNAQDNLAMQDRAVDISDTFDAVLYELVNKKDQPKDRFTRIPKGVILFAKEIKPSDALFIRDLQVAGLVTEEGSATSHMAIMARAWGIPMLVGVEPCTDLLGLTKTEVILDCETGTVILDADPETLESFKKTLFEKKLQEESLIVTASDDSLITKTKDGVPIRLLSNIALPDEVTENMFRISSGIGLFRTEFLLLDTGKIPDEETQFEIYSALVKKVANRPIIMRTFDIGADKMFDEQNILSEKNPMLGWRGIRYCLSRSVVFKAQLKAILRVASFSDVRILVPMISTIEEIEKTRSLVLEAEKELASENKAFSSVPFGIMVEVPSIAIMAKQCARYVDFMSIGTNDLTQYVMAADRENVKVEKLASYFNPGVLSLIESVIHSEKYIKGSLHHNEPKISMCGEMAGDELASVLLLGMGLRSFSMQSRKIPAMHKFFSKLRLSDAKKIAHKVKPLSKADEIKQTIHQELKQLGIY